MANPLQYEDSPYLKQHASNPVAWLPWSDEAFKLAGKENRLIFLSIGYSTCHWCHVMEEESFEDEGVAQLLNKNYISIKVDREEMPHIDKYYQDIHFLLNKRGGGWPLTIIMMPDSRVIFAATYLPKNNRGNMMGLVELLNFLVKKYKQEPEEFEKSAQSIQEAYERYKNHKTPPLPLNEQMVNTFIANIEQSFDRQHKGIGEAPKFPHASTFNTLLDIFAIYGNKDAFTLAKDVLNAMMRGGICDQIEGGFYRYSVDSAWQIPHFEKMLYTNGELLECYSKLFSFTKDDAHKEVVFNIIDAMNERFLKEGLYFSASDADSEGEEGKYFVFEYEKAKEALIKEGFSKEEANDILEYFHITKKGNFEHGTTNPYREAKLKPKKLEFAQKTLKKLRQSIPYPFIDEKILTSWNALFIKGLFEAAKRVDWDYTHLALSSLDTLLQTVYIEDKLFHQYLFNSSLKVDALLEDYGFLCEILLEAYEISGDEKYLNIVRKLAYEAKNRLYKNLSWQLGEDFAVDASLEDNAYKSPLSTMISVLATLSLFEEDMELFEEAQKMLYIYSGDISKHPHAYPEALRAWLKLNKKEILIKTPKTQLSSTQKAIQELNNPLIRINVHDQEYFMACQIGNCFAHDKNIRVILQEVQKRVSIDNN